MPGLEVLVEVANSISQNWNVVDYAKAVGFPVIGVCSTVAVVMARIRQIAKEDSKGYEANSRRYAGQK